MKASFSLNRWGAIALPALALAIPIFSGLLVRFGVVGMPVMAQASELTSLSTPISTVKAGAGSFVEQAESIRRVNALRESPENLLERITQCQQWLQADVAPNAERRAECVELLAVVQQTLQEYDASRPKQSMDALMQGMREALSPHSSIGAPTR